jgi:dihydroorotase
MADYEQTQTTAPLFIANVKIVGQGRSTNILIDGRGKIQAINLPEIPVQSCTILDGKGAWISAGWTDLHAHVWRGGTDLSVDPTVCGLDRGVHTIVDAGSAGEANFEGLRDFIITPAQERIKAFLNLGSIGLTSSRTVSELDNWRDVNLERIIDVVNANRDTIIGLKVRASGYITGNWGITPVKMARRLGRILKLPVMAHVGEPPPLIDEVLAELGAGDVVTHCFNGKYLGSLIEDDDLFQMAVQCAERGIRMDVGHGGASFSYRAAKVAMKRGLMPFSISTDVHARSIEGKVNDLATTMSKLLNLGMPFTNVIEAVTSAPNSVIGERTSGHFDIGTVAEFTLFDVVDSEAAAVDSHGVSARLEKMIEPRHTVRGTTVREASRYLSTKSQISCPHCGGKFQK